jgi:hypothetical protein
MPYSSCGCDGYLAGEKAERERGRADRGREEKRREEGLG